MDVKPPTLHTDPVNPLLGVMAAPAVGAVFPKINASMQMMAAAAREALKHSPVPSSLCPMCVMFITAAHTHKQDGRLPSCVSRPDPVAS